MGVAVFTRFRWQISLKYAGANVCAIHCNKEVVISAEIQID
jgi:hypothetical protein